MCKSVQWSWRYEVIKNITYIQDTREKHNPSLAVGKNRGALKKDLSNFVRKQKKPVAFTVTLCAPALRLASIYKKINVHYS